MAIKLITTDDGSHSLINTEIDEVYHSHYGAITESKHIYINAGFNYVMEKQSQINILEVGFGTGLNAFLTYLRSKITNIPVLYYALEPFPVPNEIISTLNYPQILAQDETTIFKKLHEAKWDVKTFISKKFIFLKIKEPVESVELPNNFFHLIYFDAFAPDIQAEMWRDEIFKKMSKSSKKDGVLVTYSTKGAVKRNLVKAGYKIEKIPGPPGKREVLRADLIKPT
ncbi:MAG: tRNA (5-methylaminomethyl-2-thiouridine)(34)-methyltransferase MnmD [Bacteroidales bacterium]|nr:tRNA (5-methylaminomethyl-2-thiouridine)(34)-methyltransferase MnmD [Bacteroidales bacterium]